MTRIKEESRRKFLQKLITGTTAMGLTPYMMSLQGCTEEDLTLKIPHRSLGKTGELVSMYSLGGQSKLEEAYGHDEAIDIINKAIDLGINYIDTSAYYGGPNAKGTGIGPTMSRVNAQVYYLSRAVLRQNAAHKCCQNQ